MVFRMAFRFQGRGCKPPAGGNTNGEQGRTYPVFVPEPEVKAMAQGWFVFTTALFVFRAFFVFRTPWFSEGAVGRPRVRQA